MGERGGDVVKGGEGHYGGRGRGRCGGRGWGIVEGGNVTVGECKVAEVMELVELPQVLVDPLQKYRSAKHMLLGCCA